MTERLFFLCVLFLIGEAIALLIGKGISKSGKLHWFCFKNIVLCLSDIVIGIILLLSFLKNPELTLLNLNFLLVLVLAVTHFFRTIEYPFKKDNVFLFNFPLFIVNNLKLIIFCLLLLN